MTQLHAGGRRHEEKIHTIYATYSNVTLMFVTFMCVTYVLVYSNTVTLQVKTLSYLYLLIYITLLRVKTLKSNCIAPAPQLYS